MLFLINQIFMLKCFIGILIITATYTSLYAQDHVTLLIDSLTFVKIHEERARLSNEIAWELKDTDWKRTLHYLEYSEEESKASGSYETLAKFYVNAANIYYDKEVLDVALNYYQKAYLIYSQNNDKQEIFKLENDLAIIYARMNDNDKALYYFRKVYEYQAKQKDSIYLAKILNNMGTLFLKEDVDSSETYYLKSLEIASRLNNIELHAYLYTNLGRVYYLMDEQQKAQEYFEKSLAIAKTNLDDGTKSMVFQLASEYFFKSKQNDSAIHYAKKAIDLLKEDTYSFKKQDVVRTLYKAYLIKEDYKNASTYFEMYDVIRDSINVEEKAVNVERLKLEMEYRTKDNIRTLEVNKKKSGYIIIGLSLISGLLILIIILVRYRNRLSKVQLEKELIEAKRKELNVSLELKNNMLIAKAMTEIYRTEVILGILEDLKDIKLKAVKKETQHAIDFIVKRFEKNSNVNIWKEFEISFEQVHASFYKNLNKKHPSLTSNDRRLCALLKLNLTSKEISQISGQSFKSVENARTRLRKKLDLTNTKTDLVVYLNTLN